MQGEISQWKKNMAELEANLKSTKDDTKTISDENDHAIQESKNKIQVFNLNRYFGHPFLLITHTFMVYAYQKLLCTFSPSFSQELLRIIDTNRAEHNKKLKSLSDELLEAQRRLAAKDAELGQVEAANVS